MNTIPLIVFLVGTAGACSAKMMDHEEEQEVPVPYQYEYGVHEPKTGDYKEAKETSDGNGVKGYYKFTEADGTQRIVHYTADKELGFMAHVDRIGHAQHPAEYYNEDHQVSYSYAKARQDPHKHHSQSGTSNHHASPNKAHDARSYQSPNRKFDLRHRPQNDASHHYLSRHQ